MEWFSLLLLDYSSNFGICVSVADSVSALDYSKLSKTSPFNKSHNLNSL